MAPWHGAMIIGIPMQISNSTASLPCDARRRNAEWKVITRSRWISPHAAAAAAAVT